MKRRLYRHRLLVLSMAVLLGISGLSPSVAGATEVTTDTQAVADTTDMTSEDTSDAVDGEACPPKGFSCFLRPFRCLRSPILGAPMFKVPLLHIGIALVVDVVKHSVARNEVGGIVVDVQSSRV